MRRSSRPLKYFATNLPQPRPNSHVGAYDFFLNSRKPRGSMIVAGSFEDGLCLVTVLKEHGASIDELEGEVEFGEGGTR